MLILLIALACVGGSECQKGFELRDDGLCYEIPGEDSGSSQDTGSTDSAESAQPVDTGDSAAPTDTGTDSGPGDDDETTLDDVLLSLPPCEFGSTDGRLDLLGFCADDVCVGDEAEWVQASLGPADDRSILAVTYSGYSYAYIYLTWASGLEAVFYDQDDDGMLDPTETVSYMNIDMPWVGGTTEGLGLGASMSCYLDALGRPDQAWYGLIEGEYALTYARWDYAGIAVADNLLNASGISGFSDGYSDALTLSGH